tara:strand:- start:25132 stop:26103 length:972 start_codon:yes stop_codon:yes gene_type:complete
MYSVAIIGCGRIGYLHDLNKKFSGSYTHYNAINKSKFFKLIALAEKNSSLRKKILIKSRVPVYSSYKKLLIDHKPDVIILATDDKSHFNILIDLVKYKPKFVFAEKPLTLKLEESKKVIALYKKNFIFLSVNFSRRYSKVFQKIKKLIDNKKLGKIENIDLRYSRGFFHNAIHWVDLCIWYFGIPIKTIVESKKKSSSFKGDYTVDLRFIYKDNLIVRFKGLDINNLGNEELDIFGTIGRIQINPDDEFKFYVVKDHNIYKKTKIYKIKELSKINNSQLLANALENIKNLLDETTDFNMSPAENSEKILKITHKLKLDKIKTI